MRHGDHNRDSSEMSTVGSLGRSVRVRVMPRAAANAVIWSVDPSRRGELPAMRDSMLIFETGCQWVMALGECERECARCVCQVTGRQVLCRWLGFKRIESLRCRNQELKMRPSTMAL